jgi:hypothetical protein
MSTRAQLNTRSTSTEVAIDAKLALGLNVKKKPTRDAQIVKSHSIEMWVGVFFRIPPTDTILDSNIGNGGLEV